MGEEKGKFPQSAGMDPKVLMADSMFKAPNGIHPPPPPAYYEMETIPLDGDGTAPQKMAVIPNGKLKPETKAKATEKGGQGPNFIKAMLPQGFDQEDDSASDMSSLDLDEDIEVEGNNFMAYAQKAVTEGASKHKGIIKKAILLAFLVAWTVWLGFSIAYSLYGAYAPIIFTSFGVAWYTYKFIQKHWGDQIWRSFCLPSVTWLDMNWNGIKWFCYPLFPIGLIMYLTWMIKDIRQLQSLSGFVFFFLFLWLTSKHPDKVVWRPVIWGYTLQFILGILVLQWEYGYVAVKWLSDYISKIIAFGYQGAAAVWSDPFMILHPYAMMGMSLLIYVGAVMSILYYFGLTQTVASKMAWAMSATMGTTAIETFGVAANIFLNGMDVMLMLRHYLDKLTMSEFNCFMVGNNATIAGFMFGLLILFGTPPEHLLTAAVMSSPATVAIAKLSYPETQPERSKTKKVEDVKFMKSPESSMFEAAANGSAVAGKTVLTVLVNYISFMSILGFINAALWWIGERVGYEGVSFEWLCSYIFYPIAVVIGVEIQYCRKVAECIGLKIFTTEIYAYQVLGEYKDTGILDDRSAALATYALCGFCSMSTLMIALGVWEAICPQRRHVMAKLMIRVMIQANISCFTTACVAGLFYNDEIALKNAAGIPASKVMRLVLGRIPKIVPLLTGP